jgi:hypothetical protein
MWARVTHPLYDVDLALELVEQPDGRCYWRGVADHLLHGTSFDNREQAKNWLRNFHLGLHVDIRERRTSLVA